MYLPPQFHSHDPAHARALMREHPLASLVSTDDEGFPFVTHLPLHAQERGDTLVLLGHCARPNPHWRYLQARREALVTFMGPQAYLSPSVYPDLARVPTWNYLAVHCRVQARLIEEPAAKDALLKALHALRPVAEARGGKLWCVFGCGGDRDPVKRPMMGAVAEQYADQVVLTSDNPRSESPAFILSQILAGVAGRDRVDVIDDRRDAIRHALRDAAGSRRRSAMWTRPWPPWRSEVTHEHPDDDPGPGPPLAARCRAERGPRHTDRPRAHRHPHLAGRRPVRRLVRRAL